MLVLSRKQGERILIGSDIEIAVVSIHGNRVRIGVRAPSEVPVHREELARRIRAESATGLICQGPAPLPPATREIWSG